MRAISAGDTVESVQHFEFVLDPNSSVPESEFNGIPTEFAIAAAYQNPFNSSMTVVIAVPSTSMIQVSIYNLLGKQVATLASGRYEAGYRQFHFDAKNLTSGTYFIRASAQGQINHIQKVMLLR